MSRPISVPIGKLKKDLKSSMFLKTIASKYGISSSWASILRARLGAYKRPPKRCPYCRRQWYR